MINFYKIIPCVVLFGLSAQLVGQVNYASNVRTDISTSQKMLITYDLLSPEVGSLYNVSLSLTYKGNKISFNNAFGDFGRLIEAGREKAIVWYYKNDFEGNITEVKVDIQARIIPAPEAGFNYEIIGEKLPFQVIFQNQSKNCGSYIWHFDDPGSGPSNTSELENPEHTYLRSRVYTVSLVATAEESELKDSISIQVNLNIGELPVANFNYKLVSKAAPATAWFKNTAIHASEYHWNFDDPDSGSQNYSGKKNPVHIFSRPGNYKVVLTVTNTNSMESHSHTENIVVSGSN